MPTDDERDENEDEGTEKPEGSSEDESSEEGTDEGAEGADDGEDSSSDDGSSDAVDAPAPPQAVSGGKSAASGEKAPRLSAGARIAAAKAAKAAKKAVKKAQIAAAEQAVTSPRASAPTPEEEPINQLKESAIGQAATRAGEWANANQTIAWGAVAAIILALAGFATWNWYSRTQDEGAGALLAEAVEIARAEIVAEDEDADDEADEAEAADEDADAERTFPTAAARAEAALTAYRRVLTEFPRSSAAAWARLGEARMLAETGDADGARSAYEAAIRDFGDDPLVSLRAYEGSGFTYEAAENWDEAREQYESIETLDEGRYHVVGAYHLARVLIATGDRLAAQTALEELIEEIEEATDGPEPPFPYILAQAQARLRELDPSSASGSDAPMLGGPEGGGLPEGISPEVMEALRRAMAEGGGGLPE